MGTSVKDLPKKRRLAKKIAVLLVVLFVPATLLVLAAVGIPAFFLREVLPTHEDLAGAFSKDPTAFSNCLKDNRISEVSKKDDFHRWVMVTPQLARAGVALVSGRGGCPFFEAKGIPTFSEGIVYAPAGEQSIRNAKPPTEEDFVEIKPLGNGWFFYRTN